MAMFWTEVPIAIIVVALRTCSRFKIKATGIDDWMMIVTLVSMPPFYSSYPMNNSLSDTFHSSRYRCNLHGSAWGSSSSLLLDPGSSRVCNQTRLDLPAVQHHVYRNWQDICCSFDSKTSWTFRILAEMVPLRQHCLDFHNQQSNIHLYLCSM